MQPYIVSLLAGATFMSMNVVKPGDELLVGSGKGSTVEHVGLLYVCTRTGGIVTYYPNSALSSMPFSVHRKKL